LTTLSTAALFLPRSLGGPAAGWSLSATGPSLPDVPPQLAAAMPSTGVALPHTFTGRLGGVISRLPLASEPLPDAAGPLAVAASAVPPPQTPNAPATPSSLFGVVLLRLAVEAYVVRAGIPRN
jgi:hypothetical protein